MVAQSRFFEMSRSREELIRGRNGAVEDASRDVLMKKFRTRRPRLSRGTFAYLLSRYCRYTSLHRPEKLGMLRVGSLSTSFKK